MLVSQSLTHDIVMRLVLVYWRSQNGRFTEYHLQLLRGRLAVYSRLKLHFRVQGGWKVSARGVWWSHSDHLQCA